MAQISPKQIDWSQSISGSLIPLVSGSDISSVYSLGTPSASWQNAYINSIDATGTITANAFVGDGSGLTNVSVDTIAGIKSEQIATGSVSASVDTDGDIFKIASGSNEFVTLDSSGNLTISGSVIVSGSLNIEELGTLGNRDDDNVMDLGGFF